ncbi:MAG: GNAT family N-acetyltransferase [Rhodobacter sp.]|nr:GNAT family N-acetyltransferase [Rhodobacter sp.]
MGDKITIRRLGPGDLELLCAVPEGLFDEAVDPGQARAFLDDPMHELLLAFAGDLAVGMASGTVLLHPDKQPAMFINEVGVRDDYLRRGIGRAVTQALIDLARERGCKGVWLGADTDNTPALALYRALGGDELTIVGFGWDGAFDD